MLYRNRVLSSLTAGIFLLMSAITPTFAKKIEVMTTFSIMQDVTEAIAGERAEVKSLIKAGVDLHDYQPTARDVARLKGADLIIWHGLGVEADFERFLKGVDRSHFITVTEGIELIEEENGRGEKMVNPHAWMDPKMVMIYVDHIREGLIKADPENADYYRERAAAYQERLKQLDGAIEALFSNIPEEKRWIVTNEPSMSYFARAYQFKEATLWNLFDLEEGTPEQMRTLLKVIEEEQIPTLFSENTLSDRVMKQVARESGIHFGGVLYTDALSSKEGGVSTYLELLEESARVIAEGLGE